MRLNLVGAARLASPVCVLLLLLGAAWPCAGRAELPVGKAENHVTVDGVELTFHSYKPQSAPGAPLIVAFHGSDRQAEMVRDFLVPLAERRKAIIVAPLLDEARFPRWRYHWAGLIEPVVDAEQTGEPGAKTRHRLRDKSQWTGRLVLGIVDHIRKSEGRADMPYYLIGHSAGAQFLGRLSAFTPNDARRIVLANSGSYLAPTRRWAFPYGFRGLPEFLKTDDDLQRYLALPITIYVGTQDRRRTWLDKSPGAERQGANRYQRGRHIFQLARETAAAKGWSFGWRLIEAPGVGHNSSAMYGALAALDALFGEAAPSSEAQVSR